MPTQTQEINTLERSIGRLEGKVDLVVATITQLSSDFTTMERGRLSVLEVKVNTLQTENKDKARSTAIWVSAIVGVIVSVVSSIIVFYLTYRKVI